MSLICKGLTLVAACAGLWLAQPLSAQPVLTGDAHLPYRPYVSPAPALRSGAPDTLPFSAAQPFFDDFSYSGSVPDTTKWFIRDIDFRYPRVTRGAAKNPPTVGALEFDGLRNDGPPYAVSFVSGLADRLESHYIDLRNFGPSDLVRLTFFLQPQGNGDRPEATDSFKVFFRRPSDTVKVYARGGSALTGFQQVSVPLTDPGFFHARFQIILESHGGLSGKLDCWYVDYLLLAPNRTAADTVYDDIGFGDLKASPTAPYSAFPFWMAPGLAPFQPNFIDLRNFRNQSATLGIRARIENPLGPPFTGLTERSLTGVIPPSAASQIGVNPFADQAFAGPGAIEFTAYLENAPDSRPGNDTLRTVIPANRIIAYDDGEADAGFGLNRDWGYGMRVDLPAPDSVAAVWICFVPTVQLVRGAPKYLEGENFRIVFWRAPHPDSTIIRAAGVQVDYGEGPNTFVRYPLANPVKVPARFWVGIQQFNDLPLGVGFDRSYDNRSMMYYDSIGRWTNPLFPGSLMIRPELVLPAQLVSQEQVSYFRMQPYPNPARAGGKLYFDGEPAGSSTPMSWTWADLSGKVLARGALEHTLEISIPDGIPPGLYFLTLRDAQGRIMRNKILLE